jgi:hypothetical protein
MISGIRVRPLRALVIALLALAATDAVALFGRDLLMEPLPFRQARVFEGRDLLYSDESFLHRASFAMPEPLAARPVPPDHMAGTGGSARTTELFLDIGVQATRAFTERLDFQYRFRRTEDFDGRFDRNLVGFGLHPRQHWSLRFMADVTGDKSRTDLQPEISWKHPEGHSARATLVLTDAMFNDKQDINAYREAPVTWFFAGKWQLSPNHQLRGYLDVTPDTILEARDRNRLFRNESARAGIAWDWETEAGIRWRWLVEGQAMNREETPLDGGPLDTMSRRFWRSRVELTLPGGNDSHWRTGAQVLSLRETGAFIGDNQQLSDQQDALVFAGVNRKLNAEWRFRPTLYISATEGESNRVSSSAPSSQDDVNDKLTLPFEWQPEGAEGPSLTLNPTLHLAEPGFGGGNLQVRIPL